MTARVGLIIPSSNRMVEQEMVAAYPAGVQAHITRLRMTGAHHLAFDALLAQAEEAARALVDARCEAVAFHCTANSMEGGKDGERRLLEALARAGARHATTTITAIERALAAFGARRIVLITPYSAATTEHEAAFLRQSGFDVILAKGFALAGSDAYCAAPAAFWRDRALELALPDADAYLISCANISVFGVIDELEARLGRTVVTSNQSVVWDTLARLGIPARGPGRLFQMQPAEPAPRPAALSRA
jgi:maleate isomerase